MLLGGSGHRSFTMPRIEYKSFVGPTVYWSFRSLNASREKVRQQAQDFINGIGVDQVVSVTEHAMTMGPFSVVIWYRVSDEEI